ncbi:hypothetical protein IIA79_01120 [bacterium]|nr:hypothetical protein [bacterium]
MHKVIILQARLASSRFPNKVLAELCGRPVIAHIVDRLKVVAGADEVCVAIPTGADEDPLADVLSKMPVSITRGSGHDVLGRFIQAAYQTNADIIVRATADNPLVGFEEAGRQLDELLADPELDYVISEGFPVGVTTEAFTLKTLEKLDYLARHADLREHVTLYLRKNPRPFLVKTLRAPEHLRRPDCSLSLDTTQDYTLLAAIYDELYKPGELVALEAVLKLLDENPELAQLSEATARIAASA